MFKNAKVLYVIYWSLPLTFLIASYISLKSIVNETLSVKDLNEFESIDWNKSSNPKAKLFLLLNEFKKAESWSEGKKLYNLLVKEAPQNGYFDALAIKILIDDSFERTTVDDTTLITIKNEANIREAVKHFELLISKSEYKKYSVDQVKEARLIHEASYLGLIKDITACLSMNYPELSALREIGKIYIALDNPSPDITFERYQKIKQFDDKLITNSESLIDLLVGAGIASSAADTIHAHDYQDVHFLDLKEKLSQYRKIRGAIIDSEGSTHGFTDQFSRLVAMTFPSIPAPDNFKEKLKVNRLLEYKYFDRMAINIICLVFAIAIIALSFVILRWNISKISKSQCELKLNPKSIAIAATISITVVLIYSFLSNYSGSREISLRGIVNLPYFSEFAAIILLSCSVPILYLLNTSQNEIFSIIKIRSLCIVTSIGLLTLLLPLILPYQRLPYLMAIFIAPWVHILFYFIRYFFMLFKKSEKEFYYALSKILIVYLPFTGLLLLFIALPVSLKAEAELYNKDTLLRPAYDLGYAFPRAETENIIRVKGLIDELESLSEYKNKWEKKEEKQYFKLKMEIYTPPKPAEENIEQLNESGRSRRSRILKLRERFEEEKKKTDTEKKE